MSLDKTTDPNQTFKWKLGGEKPFRILLSKKNPVPQLQATDPDPKGQPDRNVIRSPRPADELILRKKKGGLVTFYDLGQRWNGSAWVDLPYRGDLGIASDAFTDFKGFNTDFTIDLWDDFRTEIFTIDPEDWASNYRKIEYAEAKKYGIYFGNFAGDVALIDESNTDWSEQGLKLKSNHNADWYAMSVPSNNVFIRASPNAQVHPEVETKIFKITTGPNYSDELVPFSKLKNGDKIFLVPRPIIPFGLSEDGSGNGDVIMAKYQVRSREFWLEKLYGTLPAMAQGNPIGTAIEDDTIFADYVTRTKAEAGAKYYAGSFISGAFGELVEGTPASFPAYPIGHTVTDTSNGPLFGFNGTVGQVEGTLNCVIQRGSTFYYIWWNGEGVDDALAFTLITPEP